MNLHVCPWWLAYLFNNPLRKLLHNPEDIVRDYIEEGTAVVDIGCGWGFFTIPMAKLVGEKGYVVAVDIQEKMLQIVKRYAEHEGLLSRIQLHQCTADKLGISKRVDFALAFYMVHEVSNIKVFFNETNSILKDDANLLLVEPKMHVTLKNFKKTIEYANEAGLRDYSEPNIRMSRAILFQRA